MGLIKRSKRDSFLFSYKKKKFKYIAFTAFISILVAAGIYMLHSKGSDVAPSKEFIELNNPHYLTDKQKDILMFAKYAFGKFQTDVRPAYEDLLSKGRNYVGLTNNQLNNCKKLINTYQGDLLRYEKLYPEQVSALNNVSLNIEIFAENLYQEKEWSQHIELINIINNDISRLNSPLISLLHSNQLDYQIVQQNDLNIIKF
ncbi:hypothetical protein PVA17_21590 [Lysinibacillus sp. CNPSo 3705]|uniref:hypothetical protein n=1 Tax=Lysinibacillus sp. CNPSo 3705 TaxID=3028148 RepID=UPI002364631B|nr:hypothetical protein [Lysinibacillus sp. CNPSo 3705]MDD1505317.1 hypothetical protein [Lysinibacillus sp. CNPSo 3705]